MSNSIQASCPHCQTKLAANNPDLVGKKVKCPKCSQVFVFSVASDPSALVIPQTLAADPNDPFADLPSDPPAGNDPFGGLPSDPLGSPAPRPQIGRRNRPGRGGAPAWIKPALIGGGALAGVALLVLLIMMLTSGRSSNVVDMTYLPADTNVLVHVDLASLVRVSEIKKLLESPQFATQLKTLEEQSGITLSDIDTLTIGMPGDPSSMQTVSNDLVAVLRIKKDFDESRLSSAGLKPQDHNGHKVYLDPFGKMAFFVADKRTFVYGSLDAVKTATASKTEPRFEKFDFLNHRQDVFVGWVRSDKSVFGKVSDQVPTSNPMFGEASDDLKALAELTGHLRGIGAGANASGSNAKISIQVLCDSSTASGKLKKAVGGLVAELKKMYKKNRDDAPPQVVEMMETIDTVMKSLRVSKSGPAVTLSLTVPQNETLTQAMQSAPGFIPNLGGGVPTSPFGRPNTSSGRITSSMPSVTHAAMSAKLRRLLLAMHTFHEIHKSFPPRRPGTKRPTETNLSWRVHLLPQLGEQQLYSRFRLDEPWDSPANRELIPLMPNVYQRDASRAATGKTTFLTVDMPKSPFEGGIGARFAEITDGTARTAMIVVVNDNLAVEWTRPQGYKPPPQSPGVGLYSAPGEQNALIGLCDGSPHLISKSDATLLRNLFQATDGNTFDLP